MKKQALRQKLNHQEVCVYRRVSTKGQERGEYKNQLTIIKAICPKLKLNHPDNVDLKEFMSGFASIEKRMASNLGAALRWLKRSPTRIMVVSDADRIARRQDVFEQICAQGLGARVFIASTAQSLDELVATDGHIRVAEQSDAQKSKIDAGIQKRKHAGGYKARSGILDLQQTATAALKDASSKLSREVFSVVEELVLDRRGRRPSTAEISDELNERCIRTGHRLFFTEQRFLQFKKDRGSQFQHALKSFRRQTVKRLKGAIRIATQEIEKRRSAILLRMCLDDLIGTNVWDCALFASKKLRVSGLKYAKLSFGIILDFGLGCRSPPITKRWISLLTDRFYSWDATTV